MKRALHVVERQHAVFGLNVLDDLLPMLVVVQLRAQHLVAQLEASLLLTYIIYELQFASPNLIAVVDEASQRMASEAESVVVGLEHRAKLRLADMCAKLHPDGIFGIVEEHRLCLPSVFYRLIVERS